MFFPPKKDTYPQNLSSYPQKGIRELASWLLKLFQRLTMAVGIADRSAKSCTTKGIQDFLLRHVFLPGTCLTAVSALIRVPARYSSPYAGRLKMDLLNRLYITELHIANCTLLIARQVLLYRDRPFVC